MASTAASKHNSQLKAQTKASTVNATVLVRVFPAGAFERPIRPRPATTDAATAKSTLPWISSSGYHASKNSHSPQYKNAQATFIARTVVTNMSKRLDVYEVALAAFFSTKAVKAPAA